MFIVMIGEAEAGPACGYELGSLHSVVAVVKGSESEATQRTREALGQTGCRRFEVQKTAAVPAWRALLPTAQGAALRRAWRNGEEISVYRDDNRSH